MTDIRCGDCLSVMPTLPENSIDTIITDPPYGLDFMGKEWDHGVPSVEFWQAALRVAKPGAILMAFGGTRTFHRLACAIEDAGWEIRDCMMWLYGSGFPKSLDISKAIDKAGARQIGWFGSWLREERTRRGITQHELGEYFKTAPERINHGGCVANWELGFNLPTPEQFNKLCEILNVDFGRIEVLEREVVGKREATKLAVAPGQDNDRSDITLDITVPRTDEAALWQGYGTALKPAWEPIIVAMKPLDGTYAENAQKWGVAGLWIDGGRIGTESIEQGSKGRTSAMANGLTLNKFGGQDYEKPDAIGRWPANLLLDEESARLLDEQSGVSKSTGIINRWKDGAKPFGGGAGHPYESVRGVADSGGASRFFYTAKASSSERNAGLEDSEAKRDADRVRDDGIGGDNPRNRSNTPKLNFHPTVKPVDLMRYLCKLTKTPTGGVVLDPFMGSGTTGIACILEHRDFIGIEISAEYAEIARKRIADMVGPLFAEAV